MSGAYDKMMDDIVGCDPKKAEEAQKVRLMLSNALDQGQKNDFDYLWEFSAR